MRKREEIQSEYDAVTFYPQDKDNREFDYILEVLLDIRDLLSKSDKE